MVSIFLSHSSEDKEIVRELHKIFSSNGIESWIDEAEIKIGDSLLTKITEGIKKADFVAIILSPQSINSPWVEKELEMAMRQEIERRETKVLPLIIEDCEIPEYLKIKKYGDFRTVQSSIKAINELLQILKNEKKEVELKSPKQQTVLTKKQMKTLPPERDFKKLKEIFDVCIKPSYSGGMGIGNNDAMEIAKIFSKRDPRLFEKFKEIYNTGTAPIYSGGMGLYHQAALKLAIEQVLK